MHNFWGVTAKQGTNGIGDNEQIYDIMNPV